MSIWIDTIYLRMVSGRLEGYRDKGNNVHNCRCPLCGDSEKKKNKKRGYFFPYDSQLFYGCKNCGVSKPFWLFLKDLDFNLYSQYNVESFKEKMATSTKYIMDKTNFKDKVPETVKYIPNIFSGLPLVRDLDKNSPAYQFCINRKLPIDTFDFFFAENFIKWTLGNTDKFDTWRGADHPRIIIPWHDRLKKIIGYSARDITGVQEQKYYRIFVDDESKEHFFGLDRIDESKQIYVLEGEIDSLMIPNAVAVANGKLQMFMNKNAIYVPDNDTRNKHICKNISNMIKLGLKVCLLPEGLPGKDLNEFVKSGLNSKEVLDIIDANTFSGLSAELKFTTWKKCNIL